MKKWHGCQHGDTFLKGSSLEVKFLGQPQSLGQETWHQENSDLTKMFYCLLIFSGISFLASNNYDFGYNSWPTSALLHCSVKGPLAYTNKGKTSASYLTFTHKHCVMRRLRGVFFLPSCTPSSSWHINDRPPILFSHVPCTRCKSNRKFKLSNGSSSVKMTWVHKHESRRVSTNKKASFFKLHIFKLSTSLR